MPCHAACRRCHRRGCWRHVFRAVHTRGLYLVWLQGGHVLENPQRTSQSPFLNGDSRARLAKQDCSTSQAGTDTSQVE